MSEWISVKDRLPDMPGKYIVAYGPAIVNKVGVIDWRGDWFYPDPLSWVDHWRPLPAPPEE